MTNGPAPLEKTDLLQTTFLIPLRIESADRMRNIITTLVYLCRQFRTTIIVKEVDKESIFEKSVLPQLAQVLAEDELDCITHIFEQSDEYIFHRTRIINDMVMEAETPVVVNYDSDVILPKLSYVAATDYILNGWVNPKQPDAPREPIKCVYPYGFGDWQWQITADDESISEFINSNFNLECFEGRSRKWDAKYGFCQFFDREEYIRLGMENENFISYGYEDDERYMRFNTLSHVLRHNAFIYHFEHTRTSNSWFNNPHIEDNRKLWERLSLMGREKLAEYYENVEYMNARRGQEQVSIEA